MNEHVSVFSRGFSVLSDFGLAYSDTIVHIFNTVFRKPLKLLSVCPKG